MAKTLVWFSFNRSGTNHLTDLLAAIPGVASMTEVFESGSVQVHSFQDDAATVVQRLLALCAAFGIAPGIAGGADITALMKYPALVAAVHGDPLRTLRVLAEVNVAALGSIKVFPDHLRPGQVETLITHPDVIPCLYLRNPLDTYISVLKRRKSGAFRGVDTTDLKPTVGVGAYLAYLEKRAEWLSLLRRHENRFRIRLCYEDLMALGSDARKIGLLRARLAAVAGLPGDNGPIRPVRPSRLQDHGRTPAEKIANHRNFVKRCAEEGIAPNRDLCPWPAMDAVEDPGTRSN